MTQTSVPAKSNKRVSKYACSRIEPIGPAPARNDVLLVRFKCRSHRFDVNLGIGSGPHHVDVARYPREIKRNQCAQQMSAIDRAQAGRPPENRKQCGPTASPASEMPPDRRPKASSIPAGNSAPAPATRSPAGFECQPKCLHHWRDIHAALNVRRRRKGPALRQKPSRPLPECRLRLDVREQRAGHQRKNRIDIWLSRLRQNARSHIDFIDAQSRDHRFAHRPDNRVRLVHGLRSAARLQPAAPPSASTEPYQSRAETAPARRTTPGSADRGLRSSPGRHSAAASSEEPRDPTWFPRCCSPVREAPPDSANRRQDRASGSCRASFSFATSVACTKSCAASGQIAVGRLRGDNAQLWMCRARRIIRRRDQQIFGGEFGRKVGKDCSPAVRAPWAQQKQAGLREPQSPSADHSKLYSQLP